MAAASSSSSRLLVSQLSSDDKKKLETLSTADLCDAYGDRIQYLPQTFLHFGTKKHFCGYVETVDCRVGSESASEAPGAPSTSTTPRPPQQLELDNSFVKKAVAVQRTRPTVLVVEGNGATATNAVVGDLIAKEAVKNGVVGFVVNGRIRDSAEMEKLDIGVKCLGTHPRKTKKADKGRLGGKLCSFGEVGGCCVVNSGDFLVADMDGVVVVTSSEGGSICSSGGSSSKL
ncbi:unnamed protein product [Amoebophrya sp. A120]|nr:unnamed protein product [Amoebophrya sp. A120]|eukprot:GSA120T00000601001.1